MDPSSGPGRSLLLTRWLHRRAVFPLAAFVWPSVCFCCGSVLGPLQRFGACSGCWAGLRPPGPDACVACALPRSTASDLLGPAGGRCTACLVRPPSTDGACAAVLYVDPARSILLRAKLAGRPEIFGALAGHLARAIRARGQERDCSLVVPVPSHPWANLRRGFEPAVALARPVSRRLGLPLASGLLRRNLRSHLSTKRLSAAERRRPDALGLRVRRPVEGRRLLLVDDVMTTGTTVESCARALKRAGAEHVRIAVWARALPPARV